MIGRITSHSYANDECLVTNYTSMSFTLWEKEAAGTVKYLQQYMRVMDKEQATGAPGGLCLCGEQVYKDTVTTFDVPGDRIRQLHSYLLESPPLVQRKRHTFHLP